jgi:hypothetical protein
MFPNPTEFKPERFIGQDGELRQDLFDPEFIATFGYGRRCAISQHLLILSPPENQPLPESALVHILHGRPSTSRPLLFSLSLMSLRNLILMATLFKSSPSFREYQPYRESGTSHETRIISDRKMVLHVDLGSRCLSRVD